MNRMGSRINQHFVPQYFFRQFSGGAKCIQAFFPKMARLIRDAPIKGQCASPRFYGDDEAETVLSHLESQYASAMRSLITAAWTQDPVSAITPAILNSVYESVLVQRARSRFEVNKSKARSSAWMMEAFKHWLATSDEPGHRHVLSKLNEQTVSIELNQAAVALQNIGTALLSGEILSDLDFCIIRNQTQLPFVFCDSPVIFHNSYYQNVKHRGVLGTTTPGLQIFLPLNSQLVLLLYDSDNYLCTYHNSGCVDVIEPSDISQINALQIHGFDEAIYFACHSHKEYITDLWKCHGPTRRTESKVIHERNGWRIDGKPVNGLLHQFEPLHNIRLELSFVSCRPIDEKDYVPRKRDPELAKHVDDRMEREFRLADQKHEAKISRLS
jgi:hypothetical protein